MATHANTEREILTPSGLNRLARDLLEDALPLIWIEGEISNFSRPASGHLYLTLKDAGAQVRCAMFKPRSTWLPFKPADGMQVLARARVSLYEARGEFQLIIEHLEQSGEGALRRQFEQLKSRLAAEGLFAQDRKRPLPAMPRRIAVITSATGAAVRDVLNVIARRFAMVEVDVLPVPVQGKDAAAAIVKMLDAASQAGMHDVLVLARGGGSLEDLWAFNDEELARAIARNAIPVVSAVGHETDFSIADFVADLRAATPSAAAELLVPDARDLSRTLDQLFGRARQRMQRRLEASAQRADHLLARLNQQRPAARLGLGRERLGQLRSRLTRIVEHEAERRRSRLANLHGRFAARHPALRLEREKEHVSALARRLSALARRSMQSRRSRLDELVRTLNAVSPLATLARGYSILIDENSGLVVRSAESVSAGMQLRGVLSDGELKLRVEGKH
ncbi:exodeoxyribonuclease VII large subunit [Dokdonella sp.]|uniref:exodeoxyribonuclease VII large subunit n=1 Tax=Dokdonella sp. TaxID=2291710 RepID=UPI003526F1B3